MQPTMTEFGDKTRIDQTSCNTDYSCLEGDCPAFMTVTVDPSAGRMRRSDLPTPPVVADPTWEEPTGTQSVLLTGVGGTGIVTVNQVLATAAVRAGFAAELLDQIGLAQKAGPVIGHLRFAKDGPLDPSNRVTPGHADAILAFDLLTAVEPGNLQYGDPAHTIAVAATSLTPTGPEVYDRSLQQTDLAERSTGSAPRSGRCTRSTCCRRRGPLGSTTANLMLVGAGCAGRRLVARRRRRGGHRDQRRRRRRQQGGAGVGPVSVADPGAFEAGLPAGGDAADAGREPLTSALAQGHRTGPGLLHWRDPAPAEGARTVAFQNDLRGRYVAVSKGYGRRNGP